MPPPSSRILVRGVNWLGDAVLSMPAVQGLRRAHPQAHLTMLCPGKLVDLWAAHPDVNETFVISPGDGMAKTMARVRRGNFDTAVVFPNSTRSALEPFLAGVPRRIGLRGRGRGLLLTDPIDPPPEAVPMRKRTDAEINSLIRDPASHRQRLPSSAHHVFHYWHLVRALGATGEPPPPRLVVDESARCAVLKKFTLGETEPIFGLNPGAEYGPAKRWPAERFVETARAVQRKKSGRWLIFGAPADQSLAAEMAAAIGSSAANLAGQTSLAELILLLKSCRLLLTNDSGPMHLAAALGVPVVVPFGSTAPELTGPWMAEGGRHRVLSADVPCAPCFRRTCPIDFRCMRNISVDEVVSAAVAAA